jgi:hypothetical protein
MNMYTRLKYLSLLTTAKIRLLGNSYRKHASGQLPC